MKHKFFFVYILTLLVVSAVIVFRPPPNIPPLLSPLGTLLAPDLTKPLSQKIYLRPPLDYSSSTTLNTGNPKVSYLVYNPRSFKVYLSLNPQTRLSPGSFTKLLTTQVALDLFNLQATFSVTRTSIDKEPTILGLKEGEKLSVADLVRGSIATSANDAAATLAEGVARFYHQPLPFFIDLMNQKAKLLKLTNSHFVNPEGYDEQNQYSTLDDISRLVSSVQNNYPYILHAGQSDMENIATSSAHGFYYLPNWNGLLGVYSGVDGLKIAYTAKGGHSSIVTATRNGIPLVVILMGASSLRERDLIAANLLDAAYTKVKLKPINLTPTQLQTHYQVWIDLATKIKQGLKLLDPNTP